MEYVTKYKKELVYIAVVNYNGTDDTLECIRSISDVNSYPFTKIVLVDNGSIDNQLEDSIEELPINSITLKPEQMNYVDAEAKNAADLFFIKSAVNGGFSYGNNLALSFIKTISQDEGYILFLNNDAVLKRDTLEVLVNSIGNNEVLAPLSLNYYNKQIDSKGFGYLNILTSQSSHYDKYMFSLRYMVGSAVFMAVKDTPFWDERYFLYFDDIDFSKKLSDGNLSMRFEGNSVILHKVSKTTRLNKSIEFIKIQSLVKFYKKNYPLILPLIFVLRTFYYSYKLRFQYLRKLIQSIVR